MISNKIYFIAILLYVHCASSLEVTCDTKFKDLKHSITKMVCPADCWKKHSNLCGSGVYARGPICLAAIHDQRIDNSGGLVEVFKTSGKLRYKGDFRNGVTSSTCSAANVSYAFRMTCMTDGNAEFAITKVQCPKKCKAPAVFPCGTGFYHQNSSVCSAALLAGEMDGKSNFVTFYKRTDLGETAAANDKSCWTTSHTFSFNRDLNECDYNNRCENNSTCVDGITEYLCLCPKGFAGRYCQEKQMCWLDEYSTRVVSADGTNTVCDNGWAVMQRRIGDDSVNFTRGWEQYKTGFGNLSGEFWWGLEQVHQLTKNANCMLRIELFNTSGIHTYALYRSFSIGPEGTKYKLHIANYDTSSTAGDAMTDVAFKPNGVHDKMKFSTTDSDNDKSTEHCAKRRGGGWWFNECGFANLNGPRKQRRAYPNIRWAPKRKRTANLHTAMKIKCQPR